MRAHKLFAATTALLALAVAPAHADLVISKKPTSNMSCSGGICNATAADAVLNVKDLTNMLATSDVHVFAEGVATDITVADAFGWASSHQLTLGAYGSLNVKAAISVTGTSGLTLIANVAGNGGVFRLVGVGKISFWDTDSTLVINNTAYTLLNNLPALGAAIAANPSGAYALASDYDAAQDGSYPHSPIPTPVTGIFEGLGNTIANLTVYSTDGNTENYALFSEVDASGRISDINLTNVAMRTGGGNTAALVATNNGTIEHSSAAGAVTGGNIEIGGLVVWNNGSISRSRAAVDLSVAQYAGGLVVANTGVIPQSSASGTVYAGEAGGLASQSSGTIQDSSASGSVTTGGSADAGGGLVARNSGEVYACFATGNVSATALPFPHHRPAAGENRGKLPGLSLGGLLGTSTGSVFYSYATGSVIGKATRKYNPNQAGGLIGASGGNTTVQSYALGKVQFSRQAYVGGVDGFSEGSDQFNDVYWDTDTTTVQNPAQGVGNLPSQQGVRGYADDKFTRSVMRNFNTTIWAQNPKINNGYPYLIANPPPPQ